jgi:hypothetical protein
MEDNKDKGLSAKAVKNLERNEYLRRIEWGLEPIPPLKYSTYAAFDAEKIEPVKEEKEINGKKVLKFKFKYIIGVSDPPWEIGVLELIVDAKTSAKIDAYLSEVINVLDIQILRTPKGIRYKIEPFEHFQSASGNHTALPITWWRQYTLKGIGVGVGM